MKLSQDETRKFETDPRQDIQTEVSRLRREKPQAAEAMAGLACISEPRLYIAP